MNKKTLDLNNLEDIKYLYDNSNNPIENGFKTIIETKDLLVSANSNYELCILDLKGLEGCEF